MDRSLDTGVGLKASAKKDEVSLPQTGSFFAGMKKAAEQQAIPLLIDLMSARGSAEKIKAVGSDGCPSELWKYLSCLSMVVIFRIFLMRLPAMEDGRNVDSPHAPRGAAELEHIAIIVDVDLVRIQCHFRSSSSGATTIADNGHRPIHLFASNPTWMTATSPALRTRGRRGLVDVVVPAPPDFGVLEDVQDHKAVVEEKLVSIHDSVLYRFIVVGYHQLFWSRGSAKPCGRRA